MAVDWPLFIFKTSSFMFIHWLIIYHLQVRAAAYIAFLIIYCYIFDILPDYRAYFWYKKFRRLQAKIRKACDKLGESRKKAREQERKERVQRYHKLVREGSINALCGPSNGVDDDLGPLKIFPLEVWIMIFDHLHETRDVMSCYYSCDWFRRFLETRKNAEALAVVDCHLDHSFSSLATLQTKDFLKCRLVSKSWKSFTDSFLQNHQLQLNFRGADYPMTILDSRDGQNLNAMLQQMFRSHPYKNVNPFPSRHVLIKSRPNLTDFGRRRFHTFVRIILNNFGQHVWYLTLNINKDPDTITAFKTVHGFLRRMPNLKTADLNFYDYEDDDSDDEEAAEEEAQEMKDFLENDPFPKMKHLKSLIIDGAPDIILDSALKINNHISHLEISSLSNHEWLNYDGATAPSLPNLSDCFIYQVRVSQFAHLKNANWPLTSLTMIPGESRNEQMDLETLFKTFEKFQDTLKYLTFKIKGHSVEHLRLKLPNLYMLQVHFENSVNVDFILPLKSMECFRVYIYNLRDYNHEHELEIIKFKDHVKDLNDKEKTNIWDVFPDLDEVNVVWIASIIGNLPKGTVHSFCRDGDKIVRKVKNNCTFAVM